MKKLYLSLIGIASALTLSSCNQIIIDYEPTVVVQKRVPTKLYVDEPGFVLFKDETAQIHVNVRPLNASDANIAYKTSNKKVATVSESGEITAVGAGVATIRVYAVDDPEIYEDVKVGVEENIITATETKELEAQQKDLTEKLSVQKDIQRKKYLPAGSNNIDKVYVKNGYNIVTTRDGEPFNSEVVRQNFTVSKSDAFFKFDIDDVEVRSPNGNPSFESFGYYFFNNEDFDAHVYKYSDTSAKRAPVDAQDYLGKVERMEIVYMLLDNIFTAQRKIATNQFDNALETGSLTGSGAIKGGYSKDGKVSGAMYKETAPSAQTITADMESDYDIPANTKVMFSTKTANHWSNGRVDTSFSVSKMEYTLDGHTYVHTETAYSSVAIEEEVEIVYPDKEQYQKVDTFIDLF